MFQGLCIDDNFYIAPVPLVQLSGPESAQPSPAKDAFDVAKKCYQNQGLQGSDQKDVIDAVQATVAGVEIDLRPMLVSQGLFRWGLQHQNALRFSGLL